MTDLHVLWPAYQLKSMQNNHVTNSSMPTLYTCIISHFFIVDRKLDLDNHYLFVFVIAKDTTMMFINDTAVFVCGLQIKQYHSAWLWSLHITISLMTRTFCNSQSTLSLSCHLKYALTNTSELFMHFGMNLYFCTVEAIYNSAQFPIVEVNYCLNCCWGSCTEVLHYYTDFDCKNATVAGLLQICTPCLLAFTPIIYTGSSISESDDLAQLPNKDYNAQSWKYSCFMVWMSSRLKLPLLPYVKLWPVQTR